MKNYDVAVIGAGPYGLSAAAHLRTRGLNAVVYGEPMSFWKGNMPIGMLLRSPSNASDLSDPGRRFGLQTYREKTAGNTSGPVPLEQFVDYGLWFQRQMVPDVDPRHVCRISKDGGFVLNLQDGEEVKARRVVVAAGIASFANRPPQFAGMPNALVSHSSEHQDLSRFKGQNVVVIGAGQSGIEMAALLHETGASVEVVARAPRVRWLKEKGSRLFTIIERLLWGPAGVGPAGISQLVEHPSCYRVLPRSWQDRFGRHRPAAASWLRNRVQDVQLTMGSVVASARRVGDQVELQLDDGSRRIADHVLLATGYKLDISRYDFLAPAVLKAVERANGQPRLNGSFESSVAGLYFLGAPANWSFGPLLRFVAGTHFAARAVTRGIVRDARRRTERVTATYAETGISASPGLSA
jgi:thioredoxin reductase